MRQCVAYLVVCLVLLFAGASGALAAVDLSDTFDDGVIDTSRWLVYSGQGTSLAETGGKLVMTDHGPGYDVEPRQLVLRLQGVRHSVITSHPVADEEPGIDRAFASPWLMMRTPPADQLACLGNCMAQPS
jgi:hypothetical protein